MATSTSKSATSARPRPRKTKFLDPLLMLPIRRPSEHGAYGWQRDLPDSRDFLFAAPLLQFPKGLPQSVNLRSKCPPVYNQGQLGCCTGNAIAAAIEFDQMKQAQSGLYPLAAVHLLQRARN